MAEKPHELWQEPLCWLRYRGQIEAVGVQCHGCGHKRFWPIRELIQRYGAGAPHSRP